MLGAQINIQANAADVSLADKMQELIPDLSYVLQARKLTPAGAAKLRVGWDAHSPVDTESMDARTWRRSRTANIPG